MSTFADRLLINVEHGNEDMQFFSQTGTLLAEGYLRVVIGKRGPYVEFACRYIKWSAFRCPEKEAYRLKSRYVYYEEFRSDDPSYVKLYHQLRTVAYADYKIGLCYISPFDLMRVFNQPVII